MTVPPHSIENEEAVLGAALLSDKMLALAVVEAGLRPEHFYRDHHRAIFAAMIALHDRGEPLDHATVWAELKRRGERQVPEADVATLAGSVPNAAHAPAYARRLVELAVLRAKLRGAHTIIQGVASEDREAIATGEAELQEDAPRSASLTPEQVGERVYDYVTRGPVEAWPLPFASLTKYTSGGMKRGEVTLIGGWSSHGKSVLLDQLVEGVARRVHAHLYINEMTVEVRGLRYVSRKTGIPFEQLAAGEVPAGKEAQFLEAARSIPFGMTDAAGWTAEEIAFDARRRRYDFVAIDILHLIEHEDEADVRRISRVLNRLSKVANCHVCATVHLNERRIVSATRPPPTTGDIRQSGMLKNDADNVVFVHRKQNEDGTELLDDGVVYLAKARNGRLGAQPVTFQGGRMRFVLPPRREDPVPAAPDQPF